LRKLVEAQAVAVGEACFVGAARVAHLQPAGLRGLECRGRPRFDLGSVMADCRFLRKRGVNLLLRASYVQVSHRHHGGKLIAAKLTNSHQSSMIKSSIVIQRTSHVSRAVRHVGRLAFRPRVRQRK
jgi:hypothetical protein